MESETQEQPPPTKNNNPAVWDAVIADMQTRDKIGEKRYGTRLQPHNGRNSLQDAYEEALDLCAYLKQRIMEDDWQPIETAPKDGTGILVYFGLIGVREVLWYGGLWCVDDNRNDPYPLRGYSDDSQLVWKNKPKPPGK